MKAAFTLAALATVGVALWWADVPGDAGALLIENAVAKPLDSGAVAFLTIQNQGNPDRLLAVTSPTSQASLYKPYDQSGLPVPVGTSSLALDSAHIRLTSPAPLEDGVLIPLTLIFE